MYSSAYISSLIGQQQSQFSGQLAYAQQLSYPMQTAAAFGGAPPPPPPPPMPPAPPPMSMMGAMDYAGGGAIYGEQLAARAAGMGRMGMGLAGAAGGMGLAMAGLDPFSVALSAGRAAGGLSLGGIGAGLGAGALAALPMFAAGKAVDVYAGAFTGGMQEQTALNSVLRNNFNFFGGRGTMGRGFDQAQMGQIGMGISGIARNDIFSSVSELNQLVGGGAEAGMMTGVRDVTEFSNKFRKMLDTLKTVQRELGGTLTEALSFARQSKQLGIFSGAGQVNFAQEMRTAEATTGLNRDQLFQLSAQGAQISRAVGGYGRQGAVGALRTAETLGAAVQSGAINEEMLSEATGGLTGAEAMQAAVGDMMQRTARFSRRAMGRFSHFAMANEDGTGLDPEMMARFRTGDLSVSEVSGRAHRNVGRMGRARAMRQEGVLRGAMIEEGGLSGQIGMMRLMLGDRVTDQGDDITNLVLRRRFGMSGSQADLMTSLMRNQGNIAEQEDADRFVSRRQQTLSTDLRENRSMDAFMRNLGHAVQENTGAAQVREMGRRFVTRLSSIAERAMNDLLGVTENQLSGEDFKSIRRLGRGTGSAADLEILEGIGGTTGMTGAESFRRGILQTGASAGEVLQRRGVRGVSGMSEFELQTAVMRSQNARQGILTAREDLDAFKDLHARGGDSVTDILTSNFLGRRGRNANADDAFMVTRGLSPLGPEVSEGSLLSRGRGTFTEALGAAGRGYATGGVMGLLRGFEGHYTTEAESAAGRLAGGGRTVEFLREQGAQDVGELGTFVQRIVEGGGNPLSAMARRYSGEGGGRLSEMDAALRRFNRVAENPEAMAAVTQSRDGRRILQQMLGEDGDLTEGIRSWAEYTGGLEDEGQKAAASALLVRMQTEQAGGQLSEELATDLRSVSAVDPARREQIRRELGRMGASYGRMGERTGVGLFGDIGRLVSSGDEALARKGFGLITQEQIRISDMDTESAEYNELVQRMGGEEQGRELLGAASQRRQLGRALRGEGRRGQAQAAETGLELITGGTFGQMDITHRGRRVNATQFQRILRQGGEGAKSLMGQLRANMAGTQGADELIEQWSSAVTSGRGIDADQAHELITQAQSNPALRERQREALAERQRQQDPLSTERNDILKNILAAIKGTSSEGGVPQSEGGG